MAIKELEAKLTLMDRRILQKKILNWGSKNIRYFPWRTGANSYQILIAEIFLQRTKAKQVEPIYKKFIKKYPNFESLIKVKTQIVEKQIYGLGLSRERAKRIKELTKIIIEKYSGNPPNTLKELKSLPGIGDYIARAFLVFYYNKKIAIIDSNIVRIYKRFFCIEDESEIRRNKDFIHFCESLVPEEARIFNYSLLDFAALICTPGNPKCNICVIETNCKKCIE